jgi:hypothetical protein
MWRRLNDDGRLRTRALAALTVVLSAAGVCLLAPWLAGLLLISVLKLTALGVIVYLAVRLALRHR